MDLDDRLEIERLGGLAGIGLPGSRIRCRALLAGSDLSADERKTVKALFDVRPDAPPRVQPGADRFRYRLTLHHDNMRREIEVAENELLESLQARLQDELI